VNSQNTKYNYFMVHH